MNKIRPSAKRVWRGISEPWDRISLPKSQKKQPKKDCSFRGWGDPSSVRSEGQVRDSVTLAATPPQQTLDKYEICFRPCESPQDFLTPECLAFTRRNSLPKQEKNRSARPGFFLAGAKRFELLNARTKTWCLTTWRRPNNIDLLIIVYRHLGHFSMLFVSQPGAL